MEVFKNKHLKSINVFGDYMYEIDILHGYNYIAIDAEDQVFVWGTNMMGFLGVGNKYQISEPVLNPDLSGKGLQHFYNGYCCMFAKTDQDEFYCWGDNVFGRLGIGETGLSEDRKPFKNEFLSNKNIVDIYCGREQSVAIDRSGLVYFWLHIHANENFNQKNIITPVGIFTFPGMLKISQLDCGLHHFMALAEDNSLLFTWGKNTFGQLGTHTVKSSFEPIRIEHGNSIAKICCGALSSYFLTTDNCIYVCGKTLTEEEHVMETFTKIYCEPFVDLMSIKPYYRILAKSEQHVYELGKFKFQFIRTSYSDYESYLCDKFQRTNGTFDYAQCPMDQINNKQTALDKLKMFPMNLKEKIKLCHVFDDQSGIKVIYVTHDDQVYVTGSNDIKLGNGPAFQLYKQHKIDELSHIGIDRFFNGFYCMFATTKNDHVYCWGGNFKGMLGLGYENSIEDSVMTEDWATPKLKQLLKGYLDSVSTETAESTDTELHKEKSHLKPVLNQHLCGKGVNQIYCYAHCNFATTSSGQLYGWGQHILRFDSTIPVTLPKKILFEQDCKIKKFSCGLSHFMALDDQGDVYGWASNRTLELSDEMPATMLFKPYIVQSNVKDIMCVDNNSYVLKNDNSLLILGRVSSYLSLSTIPLLIEPNIDFLQINPAKQLVVLSKTTVFEKVFRVYLRKNSYANFKHYLNDMFRSAFTEEVQSSSQIQFENIQNFELTRANEISNDQKPGLETEIDMFEDKQEQIGKRFFKTDKMFDEYEIVELIGAGSYGKVYKIRDNLSQRFFALKCISLKGAIEENVAIFTEIEILSKIQSDFIVKYYSADITNHNLNVRMEFCEYYDLNTLRDLIDSKKKTFNESSKFLIAVDYFLSIEILKEIAEALHYIHNLNPPIVHGDLKPNNIFIKRTEKRFFKLGDFGLANMKNCGLQFDLAGVNRRYLAPELMKGDALTIKSDIYCLGVIGEELFKYDNLSEENMFLQFKDVEPNNRRDSHAFIADLNDNLSKNEQVQEVLKNLDEDSIESNMLNRFFINFLFVKLNLKEKKYLEKDTLIESGSNLSRQFDEVSKIGHGQFASVYKVRDKLDDQTYAIKKINKKVLKLDDESELSREIKILSQLRNNKLVQYNNCWIESDHAYIQMEYCDGSLRQILENKRIYFDRVIDGEIMEMELNELSISCEILKLITQSLNCLHENNIIHRDLKPDNILVKLSKQFLFKISDFGLSRFLNPDESSPTMNIGDIKYHAPEVDATKNYNLKADIYSLGKIFLDLLDIPFENTVPEGDDLIFGDESTDNYQDEVVKLIMDMTDEDNFNSRPNCYEILYRIRMLKLNWERIRNLDLADENMRKKLDRLEINDIFIGLMVQNDQVSIEQSRGIKSRKFKHAQKSALGKYEQHYDEIELVATGGFGFIFKAKHKQDKQVYAIKKYYLGSMAINYREQRLSELRQFAMLDNIHIAQYKVSWLEKNIIYNQMEYCELSFSDIILRKYDIFKRNRYEAMNVVEYFVFYELFRECVEALDFLHNQDPPLTSGKLNKPLISLNDRQHFIRLIDIQTRKSNQYLMMSLFNDLKEIRQSLKNGYPIFDYDVTTHESLSIKSSEALRNKHDQILELIFYKREDFNISYSEEFVKKYQVEHANRLNHYANESYQYKLDYLEHEHVGKKESSEVTTKTILAKLDQLMISEQELRQSQDFPLIISHLSVNEEVAYKIFEGKFQYRFNCLL